ncbi:protein kinase domain-containing protein [Bermanella sp. WJH001]|uniref:bifunctional protein-serine/threonine kinase/phosphatase n=1 Tax=Bermanella sp. WJH001 TaxID=3048005 RepID=UPI0024BDF044|nr:bifunctional protein-serine/threonine kinase/phosphatase [Bermanella sp. WJH001]MDJ1539569.1 bifunctional protein-serine/threonine kinase/phosphatase [Bermanella sp. WJH001]
MHLQSQLSLTVGQQSSAGLKASNEDCIGMRIPDQPALTIKGAVAVIADGVSAAEAGKEASEMCVRNFISDYYATPDAWSVKTAGQKIVLALNRWLVGQSQIKGHVSTLSALILKSQTAYIFHIGDTRIYRLRKGNFECLTTDHSISINKDTVYLSRAMGMDNHLEMDFQQFEIEQGDVFFLSTDGVHDFICPKDIQAEIENSSDLNASCLRLNEKALAAGSNDNVSCQLVRVDALPDANNQEIYQKLSDLPFPPPLSVGQSLDGLTVVKILHESPRSQVYLVKNSSGERFILKTPSVNFEDDPAYIERFVLEQWIGKRIDSPYVVKIIEPENKTALYTLMEYVDGLTLEQWMKENPKPDIKEVLRLVELISRGIRALHRKDILHQDIKPDNILLTADGIPKIIDFGSCYAAGVEEIDTPFDREQALGTAVYSAPETRFRMRKTKKSDLFSLALVVYEILTGRLPFGEQLEKLKDQRKLSSLKYQTAMQFNPMVPAWMDQALKRALSPLPEHRQDAMSEFIFDLQRPNTAYKQSTFVPLSQRNPLKFWQGLALIEAVILVGFIYFLLNS